MNKIVSSVVFLSSLLISGCAHNDIKPEPQHMLIGKNSFGKSKALVEYMKNHHIGSGKLKTKNTPVQKKRIKMVRTIKISKALKKLEEKDNNKYVLDSEVGDFSFPYTGDIKDITFSSLSRALESTMGIKLKIIQNKNNKMRSKILNIVKVDKPSKMIKKRDLKVSAAKSKKRCSIRLDRPMTLKRFFAEFGKLKSKTYFVENNLNIPMNKNVSIFSVSQLNSYLKKLKGYEILELKEKYFSRIIARPIDANF